MGYNTTGTDNWPPRTALIVGGASGMGSAIATSLIELGARVLVADRNVDRMNAWQQAAGGLGEVTVCDVTSDESVSALAATASTVLGEVDLLVSTPGSAVLAPPHKLPIAGWQEVIDINLFSAVRLVNAFLQPMLDRGRGTIMLTGSEAGFRPQSWALGVYGTTKAALNAYAENLAVYTRGHGVNVSLLCPGLVESNFGESARIIGIDNPAAWATLGPSTRLISLPPDTETTAAASSTMAPEVDEEGFHCTTTIDYVYILDGPVDLVLDTETVTVEAGDTVVQRGTNHAWRNRGKAPIRMLVVMISTQDQNTL